MGLVRLELMVATPALPVCPVLQDSAVQKVIVLFKNG